MESHAKKHIGYYNILRVGEVYTLQTMLPLLSPYTTAGLLSVWIHWVLYVLFQRSNLVTDIALSSDQDLGVYLLISLHCRIKGSALVHRLALGVGSSLRHHGHVSLVGLRQKPRQSTGNNIKTIVTVTCLKGAHILRFSCSSHGIGPGPRACSFHGIGPGPRACSCHGIGPGPRACSSHCRGPGPEPALDVAEVHGPDPGPGQRSRASAWIMWKVQGQLLDNGWGPGPRGTGSKPG